MAVAPRRASWFWVQLSTDAGIGAGMETWVIAAALASIAATGGLAFLLYRMNAGPEQRRRKGAGDGGAAYVGGDGGRGRAESDRSDDSGDGGGGDGGGD